MKELKKAVSGIAVLAILGLIVISCNSGGGGGGNPPGPTLMGGSVQEGPLTLSGTASTLAGLSLVGSQDGTGIDAKFLYPCSVTSDGTNLYVADSYNHTIRKIVISTGTVSTLAGSPDAYGGADGTGTAARFFDPRGITTDGMNLYVSDTSNHTIRKIVISTGEVTTMAGTAGVPGSTDATGTAALFRYPNGITTDDENLYVADTSNNTIRKIVISTGVVTTLAGTALQSGSTDGTGSDARFNMPEGIVTDNGTNLYVSDTGNHTIRKIVVSTRVVTTIAGTGAWGSADGTGIAASFNSPREISTDGTNLYVADTWNHKIRQIVISSAVVTTLAGYGGTGWTDGAGTAAKFFAPRGITRRGTDLYVADTNNHTIRKIIISTAAVTTPIGSAGSRGSADGAGSAARLYEPLGVTTDGTNLYVADSMNITIRKIVISTGSVSTLAGSPGLWGSTDATGSDARFDIPSGITTDGTNLYVADMSSHTIRKIVISTGAVTTLAGTARQSGSTDATGSDARFNTPTGITTDGTNLYVADRNNHTIRKIVISTGEVTTFAGTASTPGSDDGTGTAATFRLPAGITTDGTNLYVADMRNYTIRKIAISTAEVTTLAGTAGAAGRADGTGADARFYDPQGITSDGTNLYVADTNNHTIRKIVISTKEVTTLAGYREFAGSMDGTGTVARFYLPRGITADQTSIFVCEENNAIRRID